MLADLHAHTNTNIQRLRSSSKLNMHIKHYFPRLYQPYIALIINFTPLSSGYDAWKNCIVSDKGHKC